MQVRRSPSSRSRTRAAVALAGALSLVAAASPAVASAAAPDAGPALFVNYTAPDGIARDAGEPTLGVNWNTGKVMFQAFTETDQVTFDDSVFPATATWKDVSRPPTNIISLDPILHTDEVTGRTLVSQLAPPCSIAAFTDSDGEPTASNPNGYLPSAACGVGSNFDHQTVHFGKAVNPELSQYGDGRIAWYCSQVVVESSCSVSRNGGITFEQSRPAYIFKGDLITANKLTVGCEGLHGHLNTSPKDGTAYLPNYACNSAADLQTDRPSVVVSEDEGLSWTIRQVKDGVPANFDADPAVDVDDDGTAYVAYENVTNNLMVAVTGDKGASFSPSVDVGLPFGVKNATMPTVIAGSAGRAAVAFLGTVAEAPLNNAGVPENQLLSFDPDGDDPTAGWHLYVAMTYDGGTTWTTTDLTPNDPAQRGCIWWGSAQGSGGAAGPACANNKRNLLDFIDIAVDDQGRVLVGWADGCVNRCVTEGHTRNSNLAFANREAQDMALTRQQFDELYSQEDIGVITRQSCGLGLFEAFDADPAGPAAACTTPGDGGPGDGEPGDEDPVEPGDGGDGGEVGGGKDKDKKEKDDKDKGGKGGGKGGPATGAADTVVVNGRLVSATADSDRSVGTSPVLAAAGLLLLGGAALRRRRTS